MSYIYFFISFHKSHGFSFVLRPIGSLRSEIGFFLIQFCKHAIEHAYIYLFVVSCLSATSISFMFFVVFYKLTSLCVENKYKSNKIWQNGNASFLTFSFPLNTVHDNRLIDDNKSDCLPNTTTTTTYTLHIYKFTLNTPKSQ